MFDVKNLPKTPEIARKLVGYAELSGMQLDPAIHDLASTNLVCLDAFPVSLTDEEKASVQFIRDWNNRSIILEPTGTRAGLVALAATWVSEKKPLVILTRSDNFSRWANLARQVFPQESITVFPYVARKTDSFPAGVEVSTTPNIESDIIITTAYHFTREGLMDRLSPGQFISDEFSTSKNLDYRNTSYVAGMLNEVENVILVQNLENLWLEGMDQQSLLNMLCLGNNNNHLNQLICDVMWPNQTASGLYGYNIYDVLRKHEGFNFDAHRFLSLFGICTNLVPRSETNRLVNIRFQNTSVERLKARAGKGDRRSNISGHLKADAALQRSKGKSLQELVNEVLDGAQPASIFNALHTPCYCEFKVGEIKRQFLTYFGNTDKRFIVVAQDTGLATALKSELYRCDVGIGKTGGAKRDVIGRYLFPRPEYKRYTDDRHISGNEIRYLVSSIADLDNADVLQNTNYILMAQYPTNRADYEYLLEVCREFKIVLVDFTFKGSFEEILLNTLQRREI